MKLVKPKKNLGQHFLTDLGIARRIADTVDAYPDIPVLEIGPGMGVLTQYLVTKNREVKAVEIELKAFRLHQIEAGIGQLDVADSYLRQTFAVQPGEFVQRPDIGAVKRQIIGMQAQRVAV